jgi:TonB family protein
MRIQIFTRKNAENAILLLVILLILASASALRTVAQPRLLSLADILIALRSKKTDIGEKNKILADAVKQRGITFSLTPEIEKELGSTGAAGELIMAIKDKAPVVAKAEQIAVSAPAPVQPTVVKASPPPPDFGFYRSRANTELSNNDLEAALADLNKAGELRPGDGSVFADRAAIFLKKGDLTGANEQFTKAIELDGKAFAAYLGRATVYEKLGRYDDALLDLQKASEIDPTNTPMVEATGRVKSAKAAKAQADLAAAAAAQPKVPSKVSVGNLRDYVLKLEMPVYPAFEKQTRQQGKVTVLVNLDINGKVTSAKAIDGLKGLAQAAENAIKLSKFKPVVVGGSPVASSGVIVYNFTL